MTAKSPIVKPMCTAEIIRKWGSETPNDTAILFEGTSTTWAELDTRSSRIANALAACGVGVQDRVVFIDKNGPTYFEVAFGTAKLNAVLVAANWRLAPPEMVYTINDSMASVVIVGPDFIPLMEQIASELTTVTKIVVVGDHLKWESYEDFLSAGSIEDPGIDSALGDVAMQLYTSGTTGLPKGVMLANANMFTLYEEVATYWFFDHDSINMVAMPLFHIGGCGWAMVGMYFGAKSVVVREFNPSLVIDLMVEHRATNALYVPAMLQFMSMVPGAADRDYSSMRSINYGAAPITDEVLLSAMKVFKCKFVQVYGMTETTGGFTQLSAHDHDPGGPRAHLLRSAGRAYPWVELKIVDLDADTAPTAGSKADSETECAAGEVGEVWTRSRQNMLGYWNKPDETEKTILPDGWLRTGDAGYLDEEGFLFLTDRVKDMIVSGGENVYPAEVENALASHPAIAEVAVIGVPHERWGESVKAIVVKRSGVDITPPELIAYAKERLASYKCPTSVDFTDVLPRNPSGKVLKKDLREPFWVGHSRRVN
jgi:long-chain acyl-CoA synthetase